MEQARRVNKVTLARLSLVNMTTSTAHAEPAQSLAGLSIAGNPNSNPRRQTNN